MLSLSLNGGPFGCWSVWGVQAGRSGAGQAQSLSGKTGSLDSGFFISKRYLNFKLGLSE